MALCPRGSVGAIIRRGNEILLLDRISPPKGWACPAGHLDMIEPNSPLAKPKLENPEMALARELREELGITPRAWRIVLNDVTKGNRCKHGFDDHEWWVYEIREWEGEPHLKEPKKHRAMEWKPLDFLATLTNENADPAWVQIFEKIRAIRPELLQPHAK